ncbi:MULTISPECIES: nuclear transport factor 2 family protein [unclassified Herbaspirillum]|uniref:YybH family protein n=1 Tax=unclassified Herbaspirillum TaxID=2624150 RepID=UPI0011532ACF|nr:MULTISPECIES: nuclear transport factor 2 family protein [unclassified Herbaspirillum]MBB5392373.1 ketosteroid isomerase-like protein [Herbaspirillum sp. SJZ102]TQK06014.1 ketosteroid isomerase-like protein [Herbaspirillum sp. SJZ130]TQK12508.1 ketosteroid isomerase-like protein [Herbaspirillum sp. SJZ106]TWC68234.1 ketosteroid isomerase-like protein [Herbaspirillum sp. SJZ099]
MPRASMIHGSPDEIEAAYYDALARADLEALMALWAEDEEIVCIHPGSRRLVGHAEIRAAWEDILGNGGLHIRPRQLHATQNMMTAVHSVVEEINHGNDTQSEVHVIATNVYMKTALGWRMVMHHASVAPGAAPAEPITSGAMLH